VSNSRGLGSVAVGSAETEGTGRMVAAGALRIELWAAVSALVLGFLLPGQRAEQVVVVAVPATRLVADLEAAARARRE
jgi:hypothetical protein